MARQIPSEAAPLPLDDADNAFCLPAPAKPSPADIVLFRRHVDGFVSHADELEQRLNEVSDFYTGKKQVKGPLAVPGNRERAPTAATGSAAASCAFASGGKKLPDTGRREAATCSKRMQELMRQFGTILRQIMQHRWAWPFMEPVDVEALQIHDYYEVIKKPMDFSTIKHQMEVKDGTGYKNVREIYADVRLVFTNAMTYNDEKHDVHVMAKSLLDKFEEKWLQLLPKVIEEETRQKEEEIQARENLFIVRESFLAKMARDIDKEITELTLRLDELRESVIQKCRKMSTEEKRKLGAGLSSLSPDDINRALEIISEGNPNFQPSSEEVNLDMDEQSETILWRLKFFIKEKLELQGKNSANRAEENSKRKETCDVFTKAAKKRSKMTVL